MTRRVFVAGIALSLASALFAGEIRIKGEEEYRFAVLNEEISLPKEPIALKKIFDSIEKTTGYRIINKVEELDLKKRFVDMDEIKTVGKAFDEILSGEEAVVDVDPKREIIYIRYPEYAYVDFPKGWDIVKTKELFSRKFPEVSYYVAGNRLTIYGLKRDVAKVARVLRRYVEDAYSTYDVEITVYPYCTEDRDYAFIGRRKYYGSEEFEPVKRAFAQVRHDDRILVSVAGLNLDFRFDAQNGELVYKTMRIPFAALSDIGIVVGKKRGVFDEAFGRCSHLIVTAAVLKDGIVVK